MTTNTNDLDEVLAAAAILLAPDPDNARYDARYDAACSLANSHGSPEATQVAEMAMELYRLRLDHSAYRRLYAERVAELAELRGKRGGDGHQ